MRKCGNLGCIQYIYIYNTFIPTFKFEENNYNKKNIAVLEFEF